MGPAAAALVGGSILANLIAGRQKREGDIDQLQEAARNLYTEAAQAQRQGEYMAFARALELEQRLGQAKLAVASSGAVGGYGSAGTAVRMSETFGRLDVDMERLNAARKARGIRAHARQLEEQAGELEAQGPLSDVATILGGASKMFG